MRYSLTSHTKNTTYARDHWLGRNRVHLLGVMHCKVISTWLVMANSFNASTINSQLGIADHARFLLDQNQMQLLLEHLG